jgi:hypothetical protein
MYRHNLLRQGWNDFLRIILALGMKYAILLPFLLCLGCSPMTQSSSFSESNPKALKFGDFTYEPQIKTVLLHPVLGTGDNLEPAVTQFGQWNLILEFDDLKSQRESYNATIIHCNHDWVKSDLMDLDFMTDYNEFNITNFQFSINTHIPYIHYTYNIPAVKIPGNYMIVVYRNGDKDDIILSKRFMVCNNKVTFSRDGNLLNSGKIASLNQQLNFTLSYEGLTLPNPLENLWVVIRQNQRWDNMISDVKPSFVRDYDQELDYIFFDDKKMFKGGNEFRFFDLRSLTYPGRNVATVNKTSKPFEAYIQTDKSRSINAYAQYNDLDGNFKIENLDYSDPYFTNYLYVNFSLSSQPVNGDVYVAGAFNYWNLDENNKMQYDSSRNEYQVRTLLKQGWYDYQYVVKSPTIPTYYFEGSHYETQNSYEIFVYYKAYQPRAEQLVGYLRLVENPR